MNKRLFGLLGVLFLFGLSLVLAETDTTIVTFVIPAGVDHSIAYGVSCSASDFYFVETDTTKDGSMTKINVTSDVAGTLPCQNLTVSSMIISNDGSVNINITSNFTEALPSGVVVKATWNTTGYETSCAGTISDTACVVVTGGAPVLLVSGLTAQTGTKNIYWYADFASFNAGVATSGIARTVNTIAVQE